MSSWIGQHVQRTGIDDKGSLRVSWGRCCGVCGVKVVTPWWNGMRGRTIFLYNMVEKYDREVIKATDQLYRLLILSDVLPIVHIKRWNYRQWDPNS